MNSRMRKAISSSGGVEPNLTPLIDVCFLLITFFVMLMTVAKDEAAQLITLPFAENAPILEDDQIPDSVSINILEGGRVLGWGLELDLHRPSDVATLETKLSQQAKIIRASQKLPKSAPLNTTAILRVDQTVEGGVFIKAFTACNNAGFTKFQLKARDEEEVAEG